MVWFILYQIFLLRKSECRFEVLEETLQPNDLRQRQTFIYKTDLNDDGSSNDEKEVNDDGSRPTSKLCVLCLKSEKDTIVQPCNHLKFCYDCIKNNMHDNRNTRTRSSLPKYPTCSACIASYKRVLMWIQWQFIVVLVHWKLSFFLNIRIFWNE